MRRFGTDDLVDLAVVFLVVGLITIPVLLVSWVVLSDLWILSTVVHELRAFSLLEGYWNFVRNDIVTAYLSWYVVCLFFGLAYFVLDHRHHRPEYSEPLVQLRPNLLSPAVSTSQVVEQPPQAPNAGSPAAVAAAPPLPHGAELLDYEIDETGQPREVIMLTRGPPEPYIIWRVRDPTTHKYHVIRLPPFVRDNRQAVGWVFGLRGDDPHRADMAV